MSARLFTLARRCHVVIGTKTSLARQPAVLSSIETVRSAPALLRHYAWFSSNKDEQKPQEETAEQQQQQQDGQQPPEGQAELSEAEKMLASKEEELAELKDKYLRALAEIENVRNRARVEVQQAQDYGIQKFAKDLLEVADVLQMAVDAVPEEERNNENNPHLKNLFEGLTSTQHIMNKVFSRHGLEQINPVDQKFDPNFHDAMFQVNDPSKTPGTVAAVTKTGYVLNGRTIRAACVGVVSKPQ